MTPEQTDAAQGRIGRRCWIELDLSAYDAMVLKTDALVRICMDEFQKASA